MSREEPTLARKVTLIHESLSSRRIGHAFGGALALAYYGEPRLTIDIDLNVFIAPDGMDTVLDVLGELGSGTGADPLRAVEDGQARVWWGRNPIDLFFSYDAFHDAMEGAARTVPFADGTIRILSPEHLVVCKAVFDRSKDWSDIEQIMIGESVLALGEILCWLQRFLDSGDPRIDRIRKLWDRSR